MRISDLSSDVCSSDLLSSVIILAGIISMFTKGFSLGVDFKGGRTYVVDFDENISTDDVRNALEGQFGAEQEVKTYGDFSQVKITTTYLIDSTGTTAEEDRKSTRLKSSK